MFKNILKEFVKEVAEFNRNDDPDHKHETNENTNKIYNVFDRFKKKVK